jgi:hypothetical protein
MGCLNLFEVQLPDLKDSSALLSQTCRVLSRIKRQCGFGVNIKAQSVRLGALVPIMDMERSLSREVETQIEALSSSSETACFSKRWTFVERSGS